MSLWPLPSENHRLYAAGKSVAAWEEKLEDSFRPKLPWELLDLNELLMSYVKNWASDPELHLVGTARVIIGQGTTILPGVVVSGDVIIGEDCTIGPNCHLRGPSSIGDRCHIGQGVEIKNSILAPGCAVAHLSYLGDSYLDQNVNLGGGTITANFRHDEGRHRSMVNGDLVDTGRQKLGAIIGTGVHTGINTSIYPGRKLGPHTTTRPGEIVSRDLRASSET
jgi:bifunctional UDP-N-acetylglucosamine pyrophosphorylase/glucosamine-1-phosphate N-acetyltransferase